MDNVLKVCIDEFGNVKECDSSSDYEVLTCEDFESELINYEDVVKYIEKGLEEVEKLRRIEKAIICYRIREYLKEG